ncbi:MAG: hypothetical protein ACREHC_04065, partial [Candidatus Levyibacteriota bacterium]
MVFFADNLYPVILLCAFLSLFLLLKTDLRKHFKKRLPKTTYILTAVLILFAIGSFFYPTLISLLQRNTNFIAKGEVWRLLTSLFVQDDGIPGTIFNLVSLLLIGSLAEQYWRRNEWLILFFGGGI